MDISKICIDTTTETNDSSSSSSTISTPPVNRDSLPPINVKSNRQSYQLQYQLQHQYLKSYNYQYQQDSYPPAADHADQRNLTSQPCYAKSLPAVYNSPRPIAPLPISSSSSSSYQRYQPSLTPSSSSSFIPPPPPPPPPASHSSSSMQPTPPSPIEYKNYATTSQDPNNLMKHLIEQCTSIYKKIGKYRTDPLRESERNQIIDHVFFIAEDMLKSLNTLNEELDDNNELNASSSSIDLPDVNNNDNNNNNNNNNNDDQDDSAPPSGNESTMEEYKMIRQARNLKKNARPKYRRRSRTSMVGHRCHSCNTTDTPEWRRGPDGARTLCNACGLHYSKLLRKGSLTVQTHNYMIEAPPDGRKPQPRAIQFPIIQVNNADTNDTAMHSLPGPSGLTKSSFSKHSTSTRIVEVDEEDEDDDNFAQDVDMR